MSPEVHLRIAMISLMAIMVLVLVVLLLPSRLRRRSGEAPIGSSTIVEVTASNFKDFQQNPDAVLMLHAPWCGYCKMMMPNFEEASRDSRVVWGRCDGSEHPSITDALKTQGFPTCYRFQRGRLVKEYDGNRSVRSLLEFAS